MRRWAKRPKAGVIYLVRIRDQEGRAWRQYTDPDAAARAEAKLRAMGYTVERRQFRQWEQIEMNLIGD